ncbi:MAG: TPM domain-containing protein [Candidatus Methanoperedens sp.]|nr:TPM domain-containing protein [Candidatus Methanoperedens sp.]
MLSIRSEKFKKYALLLLIIFILFLPLASAVNYPQLKGFVTDNANMIDPVYKDKITQLAQNIEKESTVEIAVVTVDSLDGESKEMYAVNLFKQAGIGKKDKDNGLLILVAKQEREYRFEVGYGLEGTITDSMKVNIGDRIIVPNFRNGEYGKGIYEAMVVIEGLVKGNEEVISQYSMTNTNQNQSPNISTIQGLVLIVSLLIAIICNYLFKKINDIVPINTIKGELDTEEEYEKIIEKSNENKKHNKNNKIKRLVLLFGYSTAVIAAYLVAGLIFAFIVIFISIFFRLFIDSAGGSGGFEGGFGGGFSGESSGGGGGFGGGSSGGGGFGGKW